MAQRGSRETDDKVRSQPSVVAQTGATRPFPRLSGDQRTRENTKVAWRHKGGGISPKDYILIHDNICVCRYCHIFTLNYMSIFRILLTFRDGKNMLKSKFYVFGEVHCFQDTQMPAVVGWYKNTNLDTLIDRQGEEFV